MKLALINRISKFEDNTKNYTNLLNSADIDYELVSIDDNQEDILRSCDGLLVPGGIDVVPSLYKEDNKGSIIYDDLNKKNDDLDYKWIESFNKAHKPIIGICRGIQILNVYFGGTLIQDISGHKDGVVHNVDIDKDSLLYKCYKKEKMEVNSYHHQVIDKLGKGLKAIAYSEDGYIEAIEGNNVYAVQWHPEKVMDKTFTKYIEDIINVTK